MLVRIALLLERMRWWRLLLLLLLERMLLWMLQRMLKWIVMALGRQLHHLGHGLRGPSVDAGGMGQYRWWLWHGGPLHGQRRRGWRCLRLCRRLGRLQIPGGGVGDAVVAHTSQQLALLGDVVVADATQSAEVGIVVGEFLNTMLGFTFGFLFINESLVN